MLYHSGDHDLHGLAETVTQAITDLRPFLDRFDSIVVTGMSGVVVGVPVALALDKPIAILRKESDDSHSAFEPWINVRAMGKRALFLDDFVANGDTRRRVEKNAPARIVGDYLYAGGCEKYPAVGRVPTLKWHDETHD